MTKISILSRKEEGARRRRRYRCLRDYSAHKYTVRATFFTCGKTLRRDPRPPVKMPVNARAGQRKRERPLSFSRLSARKLYIMVPRRACESLGSCPKSDGCTERNNGVGPVALVHALALIAPLPRWTFAVVPFAYRRRYLHVHAAAPYL